MKVGICPLIYACHYGREGRTVNNMQRIIHLRTCNRNVCHNILIGWKSISLFETICKIIIVSWCICEI